MRMGSYSETWLLVANAPEGTEVLQLPLLHIHPLTYSLLFRQQYLRVLRSRVRVCLLSFHSIRSALLRCPFLGDLMSFSQTHPRGNWKTM